MCNYYHWIKPFMFFFHLQLNQYIIITNYFNFNISITKLIHIVKDFRHKEQNLIILTSLTGDSTFAAFSHSTVSLEKKSIPVVGLLSSYFWELEGSYAPTPVTTTNTFGLSGLSLIALANALVVYTLEFWTFCLNLPKKIKFVLRTEDSLKLVQIYLQYYSSNKEC